jgi:hypothetical protein
MAWSKRLPRLRLLIPVLIDRVVGIEDSSRYCSIFMCSIIRGSLGGSNLDRRCLFQQEVASSRVLKAVLRRSTSFSTRSTAMRRRLLALGHLVVECAIRIPGSVP